MIHRSLMMVGAGLAAAVCAVSAPGADVFVGGPQGAIYKGDSQIGNFEFFGVCGGPIVSMTVYDNHLLAGDSAGTIYRINLTSRQIVGAFTVGNDASAMAVVEQHLLVAGTDGSVLRVDPTDGAPLGAYQTTMPMGITAMTVRDGFAYIGGPHGSVHRIDLDSGLDSYFACVCFTAVQGLTTDATHLILAEAAGLISRIRLTDAAIEQVFFVSPFPRALELYAPELLVSDNSGDLVRLDANDGTVVGTFNAPIEVHAMAGLPEPKCAGDLSGNGLVDLTDLSILLSNFGRTGVLRHEDGDIDGDGVVGLSDLSLLLTDFGSACD